MANKFTRRTEPAENQRGDVVLFFPKSTEFGKRIPKQKFYENLPIPQSIKKAFSEQIKSIIWQNKLSASTLDVAAGNSVTEIEVFELQLDGPQIDTSVLELLDTKLSYHILFVLSLDGKIQVRAGFKKAENSGDGRDRKFKVIKYYQTGWMPENEFSLKIEGLDMDAVWENIIIQIGGIKVGQGKSLEEQIKIDGQKAELQREIEKLEKMARNEKQPKKKFELAQRAKALSRELGIRD